MCMCHTQNTCQLFISYGCYIIRYVLIEGQWVQTHCEDHAPKHAALRTSHNIQNIAVYPEQTGENVFLKVVVAMEEGFYIINNYV